MKSFPFSLQKLFSVFSFLPILYFCNVHQVYKLEVMSALSSLLLDVFKLFFYLSKFCFFKEKLGANISLSVQMMFLQLKRFIPRFYHKNTCNKIMFNIKGGEIKGKVSVHLSESAFMHQGSFISPAHFIPRHRLKLLYRELKTAQKHR